MGPRYVTGLAGAEATQPGKTVGLNSSIGSSLPGPTIAPGSGIEPSPGDGLPPDGIPSPLPASPSSSTAAGSGPAGSSFVPIAALLALLAPAAPAIFRRLGEGPDCRAPTPFVCALERPG